MSDIGEVRYLFTGRIEERDGSYVVEIPEREFEEGDLRSGEETQIGLFAVEGSGGTDQAASEAPSEETSDEEEAADDGSVAETVTDVTDDVEPEAGAATGDGGTASDAGSDDGGDGGAASFESLDEVSLDEEEPPVSEGDTRRVEITDVGEQGDGLARIDRGYIVFVPETEPGDTVQIEITDAKENFGFAKVVE